MKFTQRNLELITENGKYSDPITSGLFSELENKNLRAGTTDDVSITTGMNSALARFQK